MARAGGFLSRYSTPIKIAIQIGILAVILLALGTVGFIEYSGQPSFCTNCHNMKPYYDSWASSSHNTVPCIQCHYAPGVKAEAMGKLQAANQVVKYITGAYGTRPWAEIEDAACLRSGCHTERQVEGAVDFEGVRFDHTHHLGELRRGKDLRCTSCHSQIVQGSHLTVTAETCFLCHFKDRPAGEPVAGCVGCHTSPPRVQSASGFVVDHTQYVADLVSCVGCHENVVSGTGEADQARCFTCHNEPDRLQQFENTTLVHRVHIAERNVECAQCHTPIQHRVVSLAQTFELDCRACHVGTHDEQRLLYSGMGGHGAPGAPSAMFLARVSCQSCHGIPEQIGAHAQVKRAGEATCMSCHGTRYANILPAWQEQISQRQREVAAVVDAARQRLGSVPLRSRASTDSLIRLAADNVALVERGRGAHNIAYADQLLRAALDFVREAVEVGQLPYSVPEIAVGPPISGNVCLQCHYGVQEQEGNFRGRRFDHAPHLTRAALDCTRCHTSLDLHGGITLASATSCDDCHHDPVRALNCAACHAGPGGAPEQPIATAIGDFPHQKHREQGFLCSLCHSAPSMAVGGLKCEDCHDLHHRPDNSCLSCHRGGVKSIHPAEAHNGCAVCHGQRVAGINRWSRQVCTVCHSDKLEHNAPVDCHLCHSMPELAGPSQD